jgi:hypothetical protein
MIHTSAIIPTLPIFSKPEGLPDTIQLPLPDRPAGERLTWDPVRRVFLSNQTEELLLPWFVARLLYRYHYPHPVPTAHEFTHQN